MKKHPSINDSQASVESSSQLIDQKLLKQLVKQMKIMNFWVTLFGSLLLVSLMISGFLLWQLVTFVQETNRKIDEARTNVSETLDVKKKACQSESAFGGWLRDKTGACDEE